VVVVTIKSMTVMFRFRTIDNGNALLINHLLLTPTIARIVMPFCLGTQAELWNGRLAMIGFLAYLLWDLAGYSVLRDVLNFIG